MLIDRKLLCSMFYSVANYMKNHTEILSEIDSRFGDGDHGVTISKIADLMLDKTNHLLSSTQTFKSFFTELGEAITNVGGGSAGPLYGTYFEGYGEDLSDEVELDVAVFKQVLNNGLLNLQSITKAQVGDKTMMDTLIPATKAILETNGSIGEVVRAGRLAAEAGAKASEGYVSKFGRARFYKEATIGTPDAGAVSCTYIFIGFDEAINQQEV
jgi:phosphoenolpyruvate---glycerone phosphotransferase subunit DhaL